MTLEHREKTVPKARTGQQPETGPESNDARHQGRELPDVLVDRRTEVESSRVWHSGEEADHVCEADHSLTVEESERYQRLPQVERLPPNQKPDAEISNQELNDDIHACPVMRLSAGLERDETTYGQ